MGRDGESSDKFKEIICERSRSESVGDYDLKVIPSEAEFVVHYNVVTCFVIHTSRFCNPNYDVVCSSRRVRRRASTERR
jgi:hypothetical protein